MVHKKSILWDIKSTFWYTKMKYHHLIHKMCPLVQNKKTHLNVEMKVMQHAIYMKVSFSTGGASFREYFSLKDDLPSNRRFSFEASGLCPVTMWPLPLGVLEMYYWVIFSLDSFKVPFGYKECTFWVQRKYLLGAKKVPLGAKKVPFGCNEVPWVQRKFPASFDNYTVV